MLGSAILVQEIKVKKAPSKEDLLRKRYIRKHYEEGDALRIFDWRSLGEVEWRGKEQETVELTIVSAKNPKPHKVIVAGNLAEQVAELFEVIEDSDDGGERQRTGDEEWRGEWVVLREVKTAGKKHKNTFERTGQRGAVLQFAEAKQ